MAHASFICHPREEPADGLDRPLGLRARDYPRKLLLQIGEVVFRIPAIHIQRRSDRAAKEVLVRANPIDEFWRLELQHRQGNDVLEAAESRQDAQLRLQRVRKPPNLPYGGEPIVQKRQVDAAPPLVVEVLLPVGKRIENRVDILEKHPLQVTRGNRRQAHRNLDYLLQIIGPIALLDFAQSPRNYLLIE